MAATHSRPSSAGPLITRGIIALLYLAGAVLGAVYGYGFGVQIGGQTMGVVTAATGVVFCTLLVSGAIEQLLKWLRAGQA